MEIVFTIFIAGIFILIFYNTWFLPRYNDRKISNLLKKASPVLKKLVEIAKKKYKIRFAYHRNPKAASWVALFDKNGVAKEIEVPYYFLKYLKIRGTLPFFEVIEEFEFSLAHEIGHIEIGLKKPNCRHFNNRDCLYEELRAHKKALEILQRITDFNVWKNRILSKCPPPPTFFEVLMIDVSLQCMHCTKKHPSGKGKANAAHNDCSKKDEINQIYYQLENLLS